MHVIGLIVLAGIVVWLLFSRLSTSGKSGDKWILLVIVGVSIFAIVFMAWRLMEIDTERSSYKSFFEIAAETAHMYQLKANYENADDTERHHALSRYLVSCRKVMGAYSGLNQISLVGDDAMRTRTAEKLDVSVVNAACVAGVSVVMLDDNATDRRDAVESLSSMLGESRLYQSADASNTIKGELRRYGRQGDRVWEYLWALRHYWGGKDEDALRYLRNALGSEWVSTGQIGDGLEDRLAINQQDHCWFGYLWYCSGDENRALREYRISAGRDKNVKDMRNAYLKKPLTIR